MLSLYPYRTRARATKRNEPWILWEGRYMDWPINHSRLNISKNLACEQRQASTCLDGEQQARGGEKNGFVAFDCDTLPKQMSLLAAYQKPEGLGKLIEDIFSRYKDCCNGERTVAGYKGGHVEKYLLMKLNIPCLNLETLGCPKYDKLRHIIPQQKLLPSCGFHDDDTVHHCSITECHVFSVLVQKFHCKTCKRVIKDSFFI